MSFVTCRRKKVPRPRSIPFTHRKQLKAEPMVDAGVFLSAGWRWLAMLNYQIDAEVLVPYVPAGTVLDTWHDKAYVSVVGFMFLRTKVLGIPVPWHRDFEELNLRLYVRRPHPEGDRRGVAFIQEIVPRRAIAAVARTLYNEKYVALPMRHEIDLVDGRVQSGATIRYDWRLDQRWNHVQVTTVGEPALAQSGSAEEFITEHYWGYAAQRDGGTVEYQVEHPRWKLWQVRDARLDCDAENLYGEQFGSVLSGAPDSALLAEGSEVIVRRGRRI